MNLDPEKNNIQQMTLENASLKRFVKYLVDICTSGSRRGRFREFDPPPPPPPPPLEK